MHKSLKTQAVTTHAISAQFVEQAFLAAGVRSQVPHESVAAALSSLQRLTTEAFGRIQFATEPSTYALMLVREARDAAV